MQLKAGIYLDSNSGAPLRPGVREALLNLLGGVHSSHPFPNPSSLHSSGRYAKKLLAQSRQQIAQSLGPSIDPTQITFTSSGTEANQLAIRSVLERKILEGKKPHWITSATEHDSVIQMTHWLKARGGSVSYLPVDDNGIFQLSCLSRLWTEETALVSLLWVNNETGVINDMSKAAQLVKSLGGCLHVDAAQAWGKISIDLNTLGADFVSFSGHKIGSPAGIGLLWSSLSQLSENGFPFIFGKQESGRRGGTENLLGAVLLGVAASELKPSEWSARVSPLRDDLQEALMRKIPSVQVLGKEVERVANTLCLYFSHEKAKLRLRNDVLVAALDLAGFQISQGSACSSGVSYASPVLLAMGISELEARSAIRISLVDQLPQSELERFVDELGRVVDRNR